MKLARWISKHCIWIALPACITGMQAQKPAHPYLDSASATLYNPYRFPIEALVVRPMGAGYGQYRVVLADAGSAVRLNMQPGSVIANFTPIDLRQANAHAPVCAVPGTPFTALDAALAQKEIAGVESGTTNSAGTLHKEAIADDEGALEFEQHMDELNTNLNDPVAAQVRYQQYRNADSQTRAKMDSDQNQEQVDALITQAVDLAASNSDYLEQYDAAAQQETDKLGDLIESQEELDITLKSKYAESQSRLQADREFLQQAAAAMRKLPGSGDPALSTARVSRACGGAANDQDIFVLQVEAPPDRVILFARASFDHGGEEDLIFRRIIHTSQWTATAYWPLDARKVKVSLAGSKGWAGIGELDAGRPSIQAQLTGAHKAIGQLKSEKRSASYSSEGGDTAKTVFIP